MRRKITIKDDQSKWYRDGGLQDWSLQGRWRQVQAWPFSMTCITGRRAYLFLVLDKPMVLCCMPAIPHTQLESGHLGPIPRHRGSKPMFPVLLIGSSIYRRCWDSFRWAKKLLPDTKLSSLLPAEGKGPVQEDALRIRAHFPSFFLWCPPWVVVEVFGDHMVCGAASKSSKALQGLWPVPREVGYALIWTCCTARWPPWHALEYDLHVFEVLEPRPAPSRMGVQGKLVLFLVFCLSKRHSLRRSAYFWHGSSVSLVFKMVSVHHPFHAPSTHLGEGFTLVGLSSINLLGWIHFAF